MIPPFFRVQVLEETTSTNEDMKKAAASGEVEGLVIWAKRQTAGKGRQGRVWDSPQGNLYVSLLLRPSCAARDLGLYSFVTALAVQEAIQKLAEGADIKLKWPNDVLVSDKKISGVLLESILGADGKVEGLVIGVGINVAEHPEKTLYPATSLRAEGFERDVEDVLEAFLNAFGEWKMTFERDGFRPVRRAWLAEARGGEMTVRLPKGQENGTFAGIDDRGRLILRAVDGSERFIDTGDVFF